MLLLCTASRKNRMLLKAMNVSDVGEIIGVSGAHRGTSSQGDRSRVRELCATRTEKKNRVARANETRGQYI